MTKGIRHGQARTKRVKLIKTLIAKIKRSRTKSRGKVSGVASVSEGPGSDSDEKSGRKGRKSAKPEAPLESRSSGRSVTPRRKGRTVRNEELTVVNKNSDSFRQYRSAETSLKSDEEDGSDDGSSCSECSSGSGSGSCSGSGTAEWTDSDGGTSGL